MVKSNQNGHRFISKAIFWSKKKQLNLTEKYFATAHEVIEQVEKSSLIHKITNVKKDPIETTANTLQGIS